MRTLKSVLAFSACVLLAAACAFVSPAKSAPETYPSWLEMKPGYAETCIQDGGCVPMSKKELQELVGVVQARTLEWCQRNSI